MFRDLVAGFCDEQRAVLIEEMDGAHQVNFSICSSVMPRDFRYS